MMHTLVQAWRQTIKEEKVEVVKKEEPNPNYLENNRVKKEDPNPNNRVKEDDIKAWRHIDIPKSSIKKDKDLLDNLVKKWTHIPDKKDIKSIQEYLPTKQATYTPKKITPANYDAVETHGFYGLIHVGKGVYSEDNFIVHTCSRIDKSHMLSLQPGDSVQVINQHTRQPEKLTIRYVTRSKYFSPGVPVSSMQIGVDGWSL